MRQNFILIHPEGLGMSPSDADSLPEWERDKYLQLLEDWQEKQKGSAPTAGSRPSSPRFSR